MKKVLLLATFALSLAAHAFEANAIWVKGRPDTELLRKLDPEKKMDAFTVRNGEEVSLYISYRSPARDKSAERVSKV